MKTYTQTKPYDFTIPANGGITLPVQGTFYKILTSTGQIEVRRDGSSAIPLIAGQGERDIAFNSLRLTNLTGGSVSGQILIGDSNFIDDTVVFASTVTVQTNFENPEVSYAVDLAVGSVQLLAPGTNVKGFNATVLGHYDHNAAHYGSLLMKTSAPANWRDGLVLFSTGNASGYARPAIVMNNVKIPAGQGLYWFGIGTPGAAGTAQVFATGRLL